MRTVGSLIAQTSTDDLTERITVIYQVTRRNERGDIIGTENNIRCEIWAKVLPLSSRRYIDGGVEITNDVSYRITVRYNTKILPDDVILWRDKRLIQTSPPYDAESRRIYTVMTCEEMVKDGKS